MTTAANPPELVNIGQATADQLTRYLLLKMQTGIITARMDNGFLIVCRRTKFGRFVRRTYNSFGECIKVECFLNWNDSNDQPFNPLIFK